MWKMLEFYGTRVKHPGKSRLHHFLRSAFQVNGDCNLEVERQGLRWYLNPSDFVQTHLYWTGEYEPWDSRHLCRWVRPGTVFLDIGANFGYYSISIASAMQGKGQVFAFEPCATTFSRLRTNIALNNLEEMITPLPCGLADKPGFAFLEGDSRNSGAATISHKSNGEAIGLDTLDQFGEKQGLSQIDIIKIDVEGNELRVLEGGRTMIVRHSPLMMIEFNSAALAKAGSSVTQLRDMLGGLGYQLLTAQREDLVPFQSSQHGPTVVNVFCLPLNR
jgi:FkbM family methyltransferase